MLSFKGVCELPYAKFTRNSTIRITSLGLNVKLIGPLLQADSYRCLQIFKDCSGFPGNLPGSKTATNSRSRNTRLCQNVVPESTTFSQSLASSSGTRVELWSATHDESVGCWTRLRAQLLPLQGCPGAPGSRTKRYVKVFSVKFNDFL